MRKKKIVNGTTEQATKTQEPEQKDEDESISDEELEQLVLTTFGTTIVGSFFNILADPHNVHNVTNQIGNMFNGVMNIAVHAFKSGELTTESTEEEIAAYINKTRINLARSLAKNVEVQELLESALEEEVA